MPCSTGSLLAPGKRLMADTSSMAPRILVVAGEASGDLHGGHLLQALRRRCPAARLVGVGGAQ
ncbi:MAG: hypothetical protein ACK4V5_01460, partial [Cyanobium sp.]